MTSPAFRLSDAVELLERTPAVLEAMLAGLSDSWIASSAGPHVFNAFDIVGHLIHGERADWIPRVRRILEHGPARPFDKFDRYAQFEESRGKTLSELLREFRDCRAQSLRALASLRLDPESLQRRGMHAALGEVTLSELLATWVTHDLNHIAQIAKALASRYDQAVGPWREYLGILKSPAAEMDDEGRRRAAAPDAARGPR